MSTDATELTWHTYVADAGYGRRVVDENFRRGLGHPVMIALEVLVALCLLLAAWGADPVWLWRLVPVVVVGLWLYAYASTRARSRTAVPAGSVYRVALGQDALLVEAPLGDGEAPYGAVSLVKVRRRTVRLSVPSAQLLVVFPRAALPQEVLDDLLERVRVAEPVVVGPRVQSGAPWPTDGVASYTTDVDYVRRLTRAYHRAVIVTPARMGTIATVCALAVVVAVVVVGQALVGVVEHVGAVQAVTAVVVLVGVGGAIGVVVAGQYRTVARRYAERLPVGTTVRAALGPTSVWLDNPAASVWSGVPVYDGETRYATFDAVRVQGEFVFLRVRQRRLFAAFPVQLFPGPALAELTDRIAARKR